MPNAVRQLFEVSKKQTEEHLRRLGMVQGDEASAFSEKPTQSIQKTVEDDPTFAVEDVLCPTVEDDSSSTVEVSSPSAVEGDDLWRAEGTDGVFTSSRIFRITEAQQAMTHVEEAVYDALWGPKKKGETELLRLSQMGYAELSAKARVSKRSVQSVIDRLIEKHMIAIETAADIRHRKPTVYRVFSCAAIRKHQRDTGRDLVVRAGKGVFYAQKLSSTVEVASSSTVEGRASSTAEATSTQSEGTSAKGTSSSGNVVAQALSRYGPADDDAMRQLIEACQAADHEATEDEIAHFTRLKGEQFRNKPGVGNTIGLLIRSVPRCFESAMLFQYRSAKQRERAEHSEIAPDPTGNGHSVYSAWGREVTPKDWA